MSRKRALMKKQEVKAAQKKNTKKKEKRELTLEEFERRKGIIKLFSIIGACLIGVAAIIAVIVVIATSITPDIDLEAAKTNLKEAKYELSNDVYIAKEYSGVVETVMATLVETESDNLSDYMNANTEKIGFISFDTEESAQKAYTTFELKWSESYEECGISGKIIFFGTSNALDVATAE